MGDIVKSKINRLARGIFEDNETDILSSKTVIQESVISDKNMSGILQLTASGDREIKGIVYSDNYRVRIVNPGFQSNAKSISINYNVDAVGLAPESRIEGRFLVVSDAGEAEVSFCFDVIDEYVETSQGMISDLFQFANLARHSEAEALALFVRDDFAEIFLKNSPVMQTVYSGLIRSENSKYAMEEFLVTANKKTKLIFSLSTDQKEYKDLNENYADKLTIQKNGWGYGKLDINVGDSDFVILSKKAVSTEEFAGNTYEIGYIIDYSKLHAGNNYARIDVEACGQKLSCNIIVHKKANEEAIDRKEELSKVKDSVTKLAKLYFDFRMRRITTDKWAGESAQLLDRIRGIDDSKDFFKLLYAQILIAQKRPEDTVWFINEVGTHLLAGKKKQEFLYCYYLYVRALHSNSLAVATTIDALREIEEFYQNGYGDYRIMWILLHLNEEYVTNKSLRLARIKEQYAKGARTPFLYFEACAVFNEQPALIRVLDDFEIQALWWGCRNDIFTEKVAEQVARFVNAEKEFKPVLYRIMEYFCAKYDKPILLEVMCGYILRTTKPDKKYFDWYAAGVRAELKVTGLYEAYVELFDSEKELVPHIVGLYFAYNNMLEDELKAKLYVNILRFEQDDPDMARNYMPQIRNFAIEQFKEGKISERLAYIYKNVLDKSDITAKNAAVYVRLQLTKKLVCNSEVFARTMSKIIVKHKENDEEQEYILENGVAYYVAYTQDEVILFEDALGNRFLAKDAYKSKYLLAQAPMLKHCFSLMVEELEFCLHIFEKESSYKNTAKPLIAIYEEIISAKGKVKQYYINQAYAKIIDHYADLYDSSPIDEYLLEMDISLLEPVERTRMIELMLIRGLYDAAYENMKVHGYNNISASRLMRFCTMRLKEDEIPEDEFFLSVCAFTFEFSKYTDDILIYLLRYYNSSTKNLMKLWRASVEFGVNTIDIEERLISQMMFSEIHIPNAWDVFDSYYEKIGTSTVAKAYLNCQAYLYFVQNVVLPEKMFGYIEKELLETGELSDIAKMALLRWYSELDNIDEKRIQIVKELMLKLIKVGYVFEFYSKFTDKLEMPFELRDKMIFEYRTHKDSYVELKYTFDSDESEDTYHTEMMEAQYEGIFTRPFVLFYGEKLKYYITEKTEYMDNLTESGTKEILSVDMDCETGRYELLNDICCSVELKDSKTLNEAIMDYEKRIRLAEELFLPNIKE